MPGFGAILSDVPDDCNVKTIGNERFQFRDSRAQKSKKPKSRRRRRKSETRKLCELNCAERERRAALGLDATE